MGLLAWLRGKKRSSSGAVNIASPEHKANPFPFYARLRAEAPVHRVPLPAGQSGWLVTRYDDVVAVLKDERFAKDRTKALTPAQLRKEPWMPAVFKPLTRNMLDLDGLDHARLRALVQKAFTPRLVEQMRPCVQTLADQLLDDAPRRLDLIRDYALPIPTTIIAEMMGVPPEDRYRFQRWSKVIVGTSNAWWEMLSIVPSTWLFLRGTCADSCERRKNPGDDLLGAMVKAEHAGQQLSDDELMAMVVLLLIAGHETTVNLIGSGMLALMQHPDQMDKFCKEPGLIKSAVEELLRYVSPVETATERFTREDVTIAGVAIPQGSLVLAAIASANRDERQFPQPDVLDVTREPNKHLAFGLGEHYCLGASLARLEGQVAIATLLRRSPELHLSVPVESLRWRRGLVLRGLQALPVAM